MLSRKTFVEINKKNIIENFNNIKKYSGGKIMPVVKSNAYGCGAVEISKMFEELGVDIFAVAFLEEAVNLRKNNICSDILILNSTFL